MATASDLIKSSLRIIGVLGEGDTASNQGMQDALVSLNDLLEQWTLERLMIYDLQTESFTLVSGTNNYTIGSGGTFNTTRPVKIEDAYIRDSSIDYRLSIISKREYEDFSSKSNESTIPQYLYYEPSFTLGKIFLYPTPSSANTLRIVTWKPFTAFATITTSVSFPPAYYKALRYNLAMELSPEYGKTITSDIMMIAQETKTAIKSVNGQNSYTEMTVDPSIRSTLNYTPYQDYRVL